jgi:hypothetical protein
MRSSHLCSSSATVRCTAYLYDRQAAICSPFDITALDLYLVSQAVMRPNH